MIPKMPHSWIIVHLFTVTFVAPYTSVKVNPTLHIKHAGKTVSIYNMQLIIMKEFTKRCSLNVFQPVHSILFSNNEAM